MGSVPYWAVVVIGPIVLAAAIIWAMTHNRTSRRQFEETERATRENYAAETEERKRTGD